MVDTVRPAPNRSGGHVGRTVGVGGKGSHTGGFVRRLATCFQASAAKLAWLAGSGLNVLAVAQRCFVVKQGCEWGRGWGRGVTEKEREGKNVTHGVLL